MEHSTLEGCFAKVEICGEENISFFSLFTFAEGKIEKQKNKNEFPFLFLLPIK